MSGNDQKAVRRHGRLWHRVLVGFALCAALLIIFHRPILLAIGRHIVLRYAARENLKLDFRLEGNPFSHLTARNLRAFPIGASAIESIEIGSLYLDYSLLGLARHGSSRFLQDVELRSGQVVLNPAKAPPRKPRPKQKQKLPSLFPERVRLSDATLVIRAKPNDFVIERVDVDLNPHSPGDVRIERLQLPSGDSWSGISGQASYANKNLVLRNLILSDEEQIRFLNVDASRIDDKMLGLKLDGAVGGGQLSASATLTEIPTGSGLNAKVNLSAQKIAADSLNKFLVLPEDSLTGEIERLALDAAGIVDVPRTWTGVASLQISNFDRPEIHFDTGVIEVSAEQGRATLRSADVVQDRNELHFRGAMELPSVIEDFGRTPATLEIAGTAPELQRVTTGIPVQLTGSAQFSGKIDIVNAKIEATLGVTAQSIGFPNGTIEKLSSTLRASKSVGRGDTKRPWFADLRTAMEFDLAGIRYKDHIVDSVEG
ncbi:MAG: hypothetical protein J2P56_02595, partial [Verrucomicrobia bacterium]|nr:hypothetical protein [Verrucomicrobiota bacterium]